MECKNPARKATLGGARVMAHNARVKAMRAWPYTAIGANSCRSDLRLNKNRANECEPMSDHKEMAMRAITLAAVLALLMGPTVAQQQTYRNERGQITGTASTSGSITTYRDAQGGTAERQHDGSVQYRDAMGRLIGSATAPRR